MTDEICALFGSRCGAGSGPTGGASAGRLAGRLDAEREIQKPLMLRAERCASMSRLSTPGRSRCEMVRPKAVEGPTRPRPWTVTSNTRPLMIGDGDTDYRCGTCDFTIAKKIKCGQLFGGGRIECAVCGSLNVTSISREQPH